jgi:glycosyltransferase involved in cell wall biosynthesis
MPISVDEPVSGALAAVPTVLQNDLSVVMLGPCLEARGGMATVAKSWLSAGFFARWRVVYLPTYRDASKLTKAAIAASAFWRLALLLARRRVALVHVHTASRASFWRKAGFIALARLFTIPVVLHIHGGNFLGFYSRECNVLQRWAVRCVVGWAGRVLVLSQYWREQIGTLCDPKRIVVAPNFVPIASHGCGHGRNKRHVLFLGQLSVAKGLRDLFQATKLLRPEFPDLRLICAGEGNLDEVRNWLREFDLEGVVELAGWVGPEKKQELLQTCAVFVLPSHAEAMPMSLLEAMGAGLGCIATRVGSIPEVISGGIDGLLIEPKDAAAIAAACRRLWSDPAFSRQLGQRARAKVIALHSSRACLPVLDRIYEDVMRTGRA